MALDHAIDALRAAPNPAKPALLAVLEKTPCKTPEVCALRSLCTSGYSKHLAAVAATGRAKSLLASPDGDTRASIEAAEELTRAERELVESKSLTARCASEQGALRRRSKPK